MPENPTPTDKVLCKRFVQALKRCQIKNSWSQRDLSRALQIEIGTTSKYLAGAVHPYRVGWQKQCLLADCLGVTAMQLRAFYQTGQWDELSSQLSVDDICRYVIEASSDDRDAILRSLAYATAPKEPKEAKAKPKKPKLKPYRWPLETIKQLDLADEVLMAMQVDLRELETMISSEFMPTDGCVHGFSVLTKLEKDLVVRCFEQRLTPTEATKGAREVLSQADQAFLKG